MRDTMTINIKEPWRAAGINDKGEIIIYSGSTPIAIIEDCHVSFDLRTATARLISAAPDLLAALEGIVKDLIPDMAVDEFMGEISLYADVIKNPRVISVSREKFIKAEEAIAKAKVIN